MTIFSCFLFNKSHALNNRGGAENIFFPHSQFKNYICKQKRKKKKTTKIILLIVSLLVQLLKKMVNEYMSIDAASACIEL